MGMRPAQRYPDLFLKMVQNLQVGEVSNPEQSGAGFHVLKLLAKKETSQMTVTQTRSSHILLSLSDSLSESQAKNRLLAFKTQIEQNQTSFEALAKQHSTDSSASDGGDLGWARPGQFVREFEAAMNQLAVGQLSLPVVSQFGVHLIKVTDRRDVPISEREQREIVRAELIDRKSELAYQAWIAENRNRAFVEYRNETPP
jgi:peptidyl-prolyl cis-trans isomerase SurA